MGKWLFQSTYCVLGRYGATQLYTVCSWSLQLQKVDTLLRPIYWGVYRALSINLPKVTQASKWQSPDLTQ